MDPVKENKRSYVSANLSERVLPTPVARALLKLGHDLSLARRRRRLTQASMAERIQTSVATLRRLENGDPRIPIGVIAQAFFVLGDLGRISDLLDTARDDIGLSLMNEQLPQRVRGKSRKPPTGAL
jgi:transcriptional regulator with XRE-family HTH domain